MRNEQRSKANRLHLYRLEHGVSSLKFLHHDAQELYSHKLHWNEDKDCHKRYKDYDDE